MKRILFFGVISLSVLLFFVQNNIYKDIVVTARRHSPSHMDIKKRISEIVVDVMEIEGKSKVLVNVIDGELKKRKIILKLPKNTDIDHLRSFRCEIDLNERQFLSVKTDGFDYDKYLYSRGIDGIYKAQNIEEVDRFSFSSLRLSVRSVISDRIHEYESDGLLNALILGNKNEYELYKRMKEIGVSHLLVISGLHFSVIHFVVAKFFGIFGKKRLRCIMVIFTMGFLLYLVKGSYSAQRAFFTVLYIEFARIRHYRTDTLTAASFSLLVILMIEPRAILSTGLYLSYYTYLSVAFLYRRLSVKSTVFLYELLKFSLFIQFATIPISLFLFGSINLYSFIANALCVPLLSAMVPLAFLTTIFISVPIFRIIWLWMEHLFEILVLISPSKNICITITFFESIVFALIVLSLGYVFRNWNRSRLLYTIAFIICFFPLYYPEVRMINFDVLHGDATLFSWKGRNILIDTGDGKCNIAGELRRQGIHSLDIVIVTHSHMDHLGGLNDLLKKMNISTLYLTERSLLEMSKKNWDFIEHSVRMPTNEVNDGVYTEYSIRQMKDIGVNTTVYILNQSIKVCLEDGLEIEMYRLYDNQDENDNGICLIFSDEDNEYYFFGDASCNRIHHILDDREAHRKKAFFVKAPHHGSSTSSNQYLYDRLHPEYVSVSHSHKYHLPSREFMESCEVYYSTYYSGTHVITLNGLYNAYLE